jgi:hypothetical protein
VHALTLRAASWPVALSLVALVTLGACADEPAAPTLPAAPRPTLSSVPSDDFVFLTVTNTSGNTDSGSVRWAANQINSGGGVIRFAPALDGATIVLNGPLAPDGPMYIEGPAKGITISGNHQHRVIEGHLDNALVSLTNVTISKGYSPDYASAIRATSLYLQNSTVQDSRGPGSAIRVRYGFSATNSTISQNAVGGPAVEYSQYAYVTITNSTIAFNAPGPGIGLHGPVDGGYQLLVVLNNSIISNNGSPLQNCLSTSGLRYEGTNIANDWSCGAVGIGIGDPLLFPLANNGGPTKTHAIPHTSPAYNTGVGCFATTDQRYVPRDAKCDVGAFEFNDFTKIAITIDQSTKVSTTTGKALLTGTIKCTRNDAFRLALELHQDQKVSGQVVDVHSASDIPVTCTTTAKAWSATMTLTNGAWQNGAARATAQTFLTPDWVTPASAAGAVKISFTRK